MRIPRIMLITEGSYGDSSLLDKLEIACRAGVDAIQLREKNASMNDLFYFAKKLRKLTAKWGVSLLINERLDLSLACGADGLHLPEAASIPTTSLLVGKSVHSLQAALQAERKGADYLLFGPVFEPLSKPAFKSKCQGLSKLEEVVKNVKIPVIAVGGITSSHIPNLLQSGACGVASISSLLRADNITEAVASFKKHFSFQKPRIQGLHAVVSCLQMARLAIHGGADVIQFRHKGPYTEEILEIAQEIRFLCRNKVSFIINDRTDIALHVDADGVHLGQSDLPIFAARQILGVSKIIGGTAATIAEALCVEKSGADYVGLGHIFPTTSKQKDTPPIGLETISRVKEKLHIPLIAIGGISEANATQVLAEGADGIAVISAISQSDDPLETIQRIKTLVLNRRTFNYARGLYENVCKSDVLA